MATLEEKRAALRAKYDAKIREEMRMLEAQHKDSQPTQIPKSNGIPKENGNVARLLDGRLARLIYPSTTLS